MVTPIRSWVARVTLGPALVAALVAAQVLAAVVGLASPPPAAAGSETSDPATFTSGAVFSNPTGGTDAQRRVVTHVNRAIDASPSGARIRVATYNLTLRSTADKLIAAHRRGVDVDVVVDGRQRTLSPLLRRVRSAGIDLTYTRGTARTSGGGHMHVKLYLFSAAGTARHLVMVGSANLAEHGVSRLWNDLYTVVGEVDLYREYVDFHKQLMADQPVASPYERFASGSYQGTLLPREGTDHTTDDMWQALDQVRPSGATVRVCMYTWGDSRGADLARKLVDMRRQGADVAVNHNGISADVEQILRGGGVDVFDTRRDVDGDGIKDTYVHHKYLLLSQPDQGLWATYTGSHNWNNGSLRRADETILRISGRDVFETYRANFELIRAAG